MQYNCRYSNLTFIFQGGDEGGSNVGLFLGGLLGAVIGGSAGDAGAVSISTSCTNYSNIINFTRIVLTKIK